MAREGNLDAPTRHPIDWKNPDWAPIVWSETERKKGQAWGLKTIESFHIRGTPPVDDSH